MTLPDNDYQILKLTNAFYKAYPNPPYHEILKKNQRAYNCLLIQTHYGSKLLHPKEFKRRYAFSPLQYFHSELKINSKK